MPVEQMELPEIAEWREKLDELFDTIRGWLAEMAPPPTVEAHPIEIIEKKSGKYEVQQLFVRHGEGEFWVRPVAKWVVGASGRVNLLGGDGPFILAWMVEKDVVLADEATHIGKIVDINDWFWVQDRAPWKRIQLTGDLFRGLAETCLQ